MIQLILSIFYLFSDSLYWTKWVISVTLLYLRSKIHRSRFDLYDFRVKNHPEKLGLLVPNEEKTLESPFPEEHLRNASDEVFVYGVNSKAESLVVRVTRAPNDEAEAWIYLKMGDACRFELQERAGFQRNYGNKCTSFSCGGLQMHYLIPMRRWRIVFCGMLREHSEQNSENKELKEVFVKFTLLWKASSDPYDPSSDLDIRSTADAMAKTQWTSFMPPVDKFSELMNFYCQSGVITGTVSIEEEPEKELYLFGERIRNLGKTSYSEGCKFKHVLGMSPTSGLMVHFIKASVPNVLQNFHGGFIVHPDSYNRVINDGMMISRMSDSEMTEEDLTATFKAGRRFELHGKFEGDVLRVTTEIGRHGYLELRGIEFNIDGVQGRGFLISGEFFKSPSRTYQKVLPALSTSKALTVSFTDDACCQTDVTGGKGSSLGILTKFCRETEVKFTVPKGIVITTAAYKEFLTPELTDEIEKLKDVAYGNVHGNIQDACNKVKAAFERAFIPQTIAIGIEENLRKVFPGDLDQLKFAVRSSATGEDTDQMSAAGQMDTFLGVTGLLEIFRAVKKCWASQFSYVATEYKRQNGQILNSPMAVVIQEMVGCESAGVLFTCDPVTSNPSVAVITANYGLGESVVSGSDEPDTVVLKKLPMGNIAIKSVTIGHKKHKIVMTDRSDEDENTVVSEDVPEDNRKECCISVEMAVRLGKLSLKIEEYFKSPRDIEWGIKDNNIYILQSRPVTTVASTTDIEIGHELDGPLRCEGDCFSIANTGEVMPGAASPLGIDITLKYFAAVFNKIGKDKLRNFANRTYFNSGMCTFYNHLSLCVVDVITRSGDIESFETQGVMVSVFGRILDDPELKKLAEYREIQRPKAIIIYFFVFFIWSIFFSGRGIEKLKKKVFGCQSAAENGRTSTEIFEAIMKSCNDFIEPCMKHIMCSESSSAWNMLMFLTLGKSKGCYDTDLYCDFAKLLANSTEVESADIPSALQKLSQCIVKDIKAEDFKAMTVEEAQDWLETSNGMASLQYRQFMKRHGHRCLKEMDVHSIPWYEDPKPLVKNLQNMVGTTEGKVKQVKDISTLLSQLAVPMTWKTKLLLRFLLPNCRRGVREREACKSILIKALDDIRKGVKHLGRTMVAEGYLPDTKLLFFLTLDEVRDLLETRNPRMIARANHRRRLFPTLDSYMLPDIWKGLPIPINQNQDEVDYKADLTMKGIPVSQGSVKGYARVAISLEEAANLKHGEILITYSTDIAWSPYFPILGGVVTELGGLISHGAVVSREYGLPCVVGLHGATQQFVTGDYVLLDGNKGILQRLTPPE